MFLPAVPRKRIHTYSGQEYDLLRTLLENKVLEGEDVGRFEEEFASYVGCRHAVSTASGRAAMHIILECLGLKKGDEVLVPAYTFGAVPQIVQMAGLRPVFVDIHPETLNMDPRAAKKKITGKTRAIIATHIMGQPCDLQGLSSLAEDTAVIEDCAESPGAEVEGRKVGGFGRAAFFSFETVKPLNTFGGGMITTDDPDIAGKARRIRSELPYPPLGKLLMKALSSYFESVVSNKYVFPAMIHPVLKAAARHQVGPESLAALYKKKKGATKSFFFRYTNLQARMGRMQLRLLDIQNQRRRDNALLLKELLADTIRTQKEIPGTKGIYYIFAIKTDDKDRVAGALLQNGIDVGKTVLPHCPPAFGDDGSYPASEEAEETVLQIPVFSSMDERQVHRMAGIINETVE